MLAPLLLHINCNWILSTLLQSLGFFSSDTSLQVQKQCQPVQDNTDKPIEYLPPATSTVSTCSSLCNSVYIAGIIARHFSVWETLTSDPYILSIVQGCQLEFCNPHLARCKPPEQSNFLVKRRILLLLELRNY